MSTKKSTSKSVGTKNDTNKAPLGLIPYESLEEISKALDFGAKVYGTYNFTNGLGFLRIANAICRHMYKWIWVEKIDPESGLSHLAHAGAGIVMLIWHERHRPELNDTYVQYRDDDVS
jgi:hypothetical protein